MTFEYWLILWLYVCGAVSTLSLFVEIDSRMTRRDWFFVLVWPIVASAVIARTLTKYVTYKVRQRRVRDEG